MANYPPEKFDTENQGFDEANFDKGTVSTSGALNFIGTVSKIIKITIEGTISFAGIFANRLSEILFGVITFVGKNIKKTKINIGDRKR